MLSSDHLDLERVIAGYRRRAVIAIQTAFLCGASIVFAQSLTHSSMTVITYIGTSMLLSIISLACAFRGIIRIATIILAAQFVLIPTYLAFLALGTFDSAMMILPAGMISISVVVKPRTVAIFSGLTLTAAGFVALATLQGKIGKPFLHAEVSDNPVDVIVSMVVILFSGMVATYVSSILSTLLHRLAEYQSTLEHRVERRTRDLEQSNKELQLAMERLDRARIELVRGEKLAGLGSLVAGVAHELNTPIGNTAMVASTLQEQVTEFSHILASGKVRKVDLQSMVDSLTEGTDLLIRSTHRARDLVASFKQVAVDQTSERRRKFMLEEVVDDVLRTLRPSFYGLQLQISNDVQPNIACDSYPGPLGQLLTNLIQNAIVHGIGQSSDGIINLICKNIDDKNMEIIVQDNGKGMSPETLNKIFDPFFTTRLGQGGSGLGLTIVHNLATGMLGGKIAVESTLGVGTRFIVTLPRITPERTAN